MMHDRSDEDALQITQNLLAEMLGVQRPTSRMLPGVGTRRLIAVADGKSLYSIGRARCGIL